MLVANHGHSQGHSSLLCKRRTLFGILNLLIRLQCKVHATDRRVLRIFDRHWISELSTAHVELLQGRIDQQPNPNENLEVFLCSRRIERCQWLMNYLQDSKLKALFSLFWGSWAGDALPHFSIGLNVF